MTEFEYRNIENRPSELFNIPYYRDLPRTELELDAPSASGAFLELDLLTLDGVQPIEMRHAAANAGNIETNPSPESISLYRREGVKFQLVFLVVNCYRFLERDGRVLGKPYNISLQPASKRGQVETVSIDWIEKINLAKIQKSVQMYKGFNPFMGAYGFHMIGDVDYSNIESDMIGFVRGMYALAVPFVHNEVISPFDGLLPQVRKDYERYRKQRYFKPFEKVKPRRIWGCDSPIELFLLQAMGHNGLEPEIQTIISGKGFTVPHLHTLWENDKSRKRLDAITEADFYFPERKLAVFCDSIAHHSSPEAQKKDAAIDIKLRELGIHSLRISGADIVRSPFECAKKVENELGKLA